MIPEHKRTVHAVDPKITGRALCDADNPLTTRQPGMVNCPACLRRLGQ